MKIIGVSYLQECIKFKVKIGDKKYNFVSLYRSPSQTKNEFEIKNLELNLEHIANKYPFLIVVLGGFNVRMQGWYQNDKTTFKVRSVKDRYGNYSVQFVPNNLRTNHV